MSEAGFLSAIRADPNDDATRLIYADYLEEHDDPRRAQLLRLHRKLLATCCEPERHPARASWQGRSRRNRARFRLRRHRGRPRGSLWA